ncbi:hypothetical protein A5853_000679, partial [Enterococcus faecium]
TDRKCFSAVLQYDRYDPVSYTHLDVYKRQLLHRNVVRVKMRWQRLVQLEA